MTISQTVINERCNRWLADILERRNVPNPHDLAKYVTTELLAQGLAPVPRPFPLKATAPSSTKEGRAAARAEYERIRAERKAAGQQQESSTRLCGRWADADSPGCVALDCDGQGCALAAQEAAALTALADAGVLADDDVVDAEIHEADCPGGDCRCGDDPDAEPTDDVPVPDTWGPDDPPF